MNMNRSLSLSVSMYVSQAHTISLLPLFILLFSHFLVCSKQLEEIQTQAP